MSGGGRRGGRGGRGGRGRGGAGGNGGNSGGAAGQQPSVDFNLYASSQFPMEGCPAIVKPPSDKDALHFLRMPDRGTLGDIMLWFAATAVAAEPSARLVAWQATKQDKAWLTAFAKEALPHVEITSVELNNNKYLQFCITPNFLPPPPPPAAPAPAPATPAQTEPAAAAAASSQPAQPAAAEKAAAAAEKAAPAAAAAEKAAPAAAAAAAKEAVVQAVQHSKEKLSEAGHKAGEVAAAAADKVSKTVAESSSQAKEVASAAVHKAAGAASAAQASVAAAGSKVAAAVESGAKEAEQQLNGVAGAAKARYPSWFDWVQDAYSGKSGANTQMLAIGGTVAGVVAVVGVVLSVALGGKRKSRA